MKAASRRIPRNISSIALLAPLLLACLAVSCRAPKGGADGVAVAIGARGAALSRGCLELGPGGDGRLLILDPGTSDSPVLEAVEPSGLSPSPSRVHWSMAPSFSGVAASEGRIGAAINRVGVVFLEDDGKGTLRWAMLRDERVFGERTIVSSWWRNGRYHVFLNRNRAVEEGPADSMLVSLSPREGHFRIDVAAEPSAFLPGESMNYLCPVDADTALAQLQRKEGDRLVSAYLRVALDDARASRVGKAVYLSAFSMARASALPAAAAALCDSAQARERYSGGGPDAPTDIFVYAWYGSSARPDERVFAVSGDEESEWSAALSIWEDSGRFAVLYPDGRLRLSGPGGRRDARLPGLPYSFDYEKVAMAGNVVAATWAESVYPETGRAGLALYRQD